MQVISGVNNSAFFAQSAYSATTASYDVNGYPITSYLPESGVGYNAVNEVSALNGSAIAQYGAEKQFITHDSTLCHVSNSAQYALGVNLPNISADLARMMGVDETVLWESETTAGTQSTAYNLTESCSNFDKIKIYFKNNDGYGSMFETLSYNTKFNLGVCEHFSGSNNAIIKYTEANLADNKLYVDTSGFIWYRPGAATPTAYTIVSGKVETSKIYVQRVIGIHRISGGN